MKTLQPIIRILHEYAQKLESICAKTPEEFKTEANRINADIEAEVSALRDVFPEILQVNYPYDITKKEAESVFERIKQSVSQKYATSLLPANDVFVDKINTEIITTLGLLSWQKGEESEHNFVINFNKRSLNNSILSMNRLLMNMLLSQPIKNIHLNIVDLDGTGYGSDYTINKLGENVCRGLITSREDFNALIKEMQERRDKILELYGNLVEYNEENRTIASPYEVIVLLNYPNGYEYLNDSLKSLFQYGHRVGMYFVILNNMDVKIDDTRRNSLLTQMEDCYQNYDYMRLDQNGFARYTPIFDNNNLRKAAFKYIYTEANYKEEHTSDIAQCEDITKDTGYEPLISEIKVPVGQNMKDGSQAFFRLNTVTHSHAFIIGQPGYGKSVLLHNILSAMILKYAPEDLQLYLLDLKEGGVEFNRYRTVKHVKALLVDNSDLQITLEILRDVEKQMKERGKMLRDAGVAHIKAYNEKNKDARMPSIIVAADECHVMFPTLNIENRRLVAEISEIITKIAKEGRSQGVHLLFATQGLVGSDISREITNIITDHYLLHCSATDSEYMAPNSSKITSQFKEGEVYYHHSDGSIQFKGFNPSNEELAERIKSSVNRSLEKQSNGQFYFNGSQIFSADKEVMEYVGKKGKKNPTVALGRRISLDEKPVSVSLKEDFSENIMLFGINNEEQVTRVTMNILLTMASSVKQKDIDMNIYVFDCLNNEEGRYADVLDEMEDKGLCKIISGRKRGAVLKQLADGIINKTAQPSTLFILGQEKFRELKMDMEIEETLNMSIPENGADSYVNDIFSNISPYKNEYNGNSQIKTYKQALQMILERGSEFGVHTVLQIDKPDKLLFSDGLSVSAKEVFKMFKYLVMLHSEENVATRLISNDIKLEKLSDKNERLRAYYYSEDDDKYTLFTPYDMPTIENLTELLS